MENQHRKINGYRELNAEEIAMMNEVKALGPIMEAAVKKVQDYLVRQRADAITLSRSEVPEEAAKGIAELARLEVTSSERFAALAKTEWQTGLMYLTRAVAQPEFF